MHQLLALLKSSSLLWLGDTEQMIDGNQFAGGILHEAHTEQPVNQSMLRFTEDHYRTQWTTVQQQLWSSNMEVLLLTPRPTNAEEVTSPAALESFEWALLGITNTSVARVLRICKALGVLPCAMLGCDEEWATANLKLHLCLYIKATLPSCSSAFLT